MTAAAIRPPERSECVPGTTTTSRPGAAGGIPNGSRSPCTISTGASTASSSASRVFSGRPGGCSGKARQSTPAAPAASAVRHATRAPDERPPTNSGPAVRRSSASSTASQATSSCAAGAGDLRPATR